MNWTAATIHVIDFEGHRSYGVVEYGVASICLGRVTGTATRLCAPLDRIREEDVRVHGIRETDAAGNPPFSADYETFVELRRGGVFAAHNKVVEHALLKHTWAYPPFVPDYRGNGGETAEWGPWIDTLRLYQRLYPDLPGHALGGLIDAFGLRAELEELALLHCPPARRKAHCALYDALASALLLSRLQKEPPVADRSLAHLLELSGETLAEAPELFAD
ncbi:MAG: 3'-5' exonuclease [Opitutales bacterium]|nr:3'-5' exonuclease [Opitutales bacterium]